MSTSLIVFRSSSLDSKIAASVIYYNNCRDNYKNVVLVDADTVSNNYLHDMLLESVREDETDVYVVGGGIEFISEIAKEGDGNLIWFDNTIDDKDIDFAIDGIRDKHLYNYMLAETYFFGETGVLPYRYMKTYSEKMPIEKVKDAVTEFITDWKQKNVLLESTAE